MTPTTTSRLSIRSLRRGHDRPLKLSASLLLGAGVAILLVFGIISLNLVQSHRSQSQEIPQTKMRLEGGSLSKRVDATSHLRAEKGGGAPMPLIQKKVAPPGNLKPKTEPKVESKTTPAPSNLHRLAIVIPFRESKDGRSQGVDREINLRQWLDYMSHFLNPELLAVAKVYVVEQSQEGVFNKGFLFNAGFDYIMKSATPCDYLVFHDVDQIPQKSCKECYKFKSSPTKLIRETTRKDSDTDKEVARKVSMSNVGGALMMTPVAYRKVGGYSNVLAGWGIEDDNMAWRIRRFSGGFRVLMPGQFRGLPHQRVHGLDETDQFSKNVKNIHETVSGLSDLHYDLLGENTFQVSWLSVVRIVVKQATVEGAN